MSGPHLDGVRAVGPTVAPLAGPSTAAGPLQPPSPMAMVRDRLARTAQAGRGAPVVSLMGAEAGARMQGEALETWTQGLQYARRGDAYSSYLAADHLQRAFPQHAAEANQLRRAALTLAERQGDHRALAKAIEHSAPRRGEAVPRSAAHAERTLNRILARSTASREQFQAAKSLLGEAGSFRAGVRMANRSITTAAAAGNLQHLTEVATWGREVLQRPWLIGAEAGTAELAAIRNVARRAAQTLASNWRLVARAL